MDKGQTTLTEWEDKEMTANEAYAALINNSLDWYVVEKTDGSFELTHVSSILECGYDPSDYDIADMHQCWNGDELGECPFDGFDAEEWESVDE